MKIKGVNLGNWLVLEKWMSSELFKGVDADDEEDFYAMLSSDEAALRIRMHRDYFIQERDFQHMKTMGLNLVRIPVPHFIFGEKKPYVGCIEYLDKAFDWGEKYGQEWEDFMREPEYKNVVIDTHIYEDFRHMVADGVVSYLCKRGSAVVCNGNQHAAPPFQLNGKVDCLLSDS